jgi:hypothetical protein
MGSCYEFSDDEISFSARVVENGELYRIESNTFEFLKDELYESIEDAKGRIFRCVVIRYDSDISESKRRLELLRERRRSLRVDAIEESLQRLNSSGIPF